MEIKFKKVLILEGGFNEEHEVSLSTGHQIKKILNKLKIDFKTLLVNPNSFDIQIKKFPKNYICFNALHGPFGEDGKIQIILKKMVLKQLIQAFRHLKIVLIKSNQKNLFKV